MNEKLESLKRKISDFPQKPGVYKFLKTDGEVLYVGKAKNLKARVSQYVNGHDTRVQIPYLLEESSDIDYTVVESELEALYLENTLIKQFLPRYNIMLRDDKNYAFIEIDYLTEIPQLKIVRKIESRSESTNPTRMPRKKINSGNSDAIRGSGSLYFGPYSAAYKIKQTLNTVRNIFNYCSNEKITGKPCFYFHLHRCPGVCAGQMSLDEYKKHLEKIKLFLKGNTSQAEKGLAIEMRESAGKKQFEKAARLRDQLKSLKLLSEKQSVILQKPANWDLVSLHMENNFACVNLFKIRSGKLIDKENFIYSEAGRQTQAGNENRVQQTFLENYYLETSDIPREIYLSPSLSNSMELDTKIIKSLVKSRFEKSVKIHFPKKGKPKDLIKLGQLNAKEYLDKYLRDQAGNRDKIAAALEGLKNILALPNLPRRIECYDISNIQGTNPVGSMVVFEDGLPAKSQYRKFKIRGKATPDDFFMMKEMLGRRLEHSVKRIENSKEKSQNSQNLKATRYTLPASKHWPLPDLMVIDGGKGQLSAALDILNAKRYTLPAIPVIGLAKRIEEIFLPGKSEPIILPQDHPSLQLLQRLRDEAHRFGITFHRDLRSKQAVRSALDDIAGVGPKTKKLLKKKFGTVAEIKKASLETLALFIGQKLAKKIKGGI